MSKSPKAQPARSLGDFVRIAGAHYYESMLLDYVTALLILCTLYIPSNTFAQSNSPSTAPVPKQLTIVLVGDSTVCTYPDTRAERGWGQFIAERFDNVTVLNLAAAGRSTKTFIQEGRWTKALATKPDFILIQFGHNDSHSPTQPEATNAATTYKDFLRQYIDDSRKIGATPILITSMVRRQFDSEGKLIDGLAPYAQAMKEVALEKKVALIDLHASSKKIVENLGPEASKAMANKAGDSTHFNEKGARSMADLVIQELPTAEPRLKHYLKESK